MKRSEFSTKYNKKNSLQRIDKNQPLSQECEEKREKSEVAEVFRSIRLLSKSFSLWKFSASFLTQDDSLENIDLLEQSLEKYEQISRLELPKTRSQTISIDMPKAYHTDSNERPLLNKKEILVNDVFVINNRIDRNSIWSNEG